MGIQISVPFAPRPKSFASTPKAQRCHGDSDFALLRTLADAYGFALRGAIRDRVEWSSRCDLGLTRHPKKARHCKICDRVKLSSRRSAILRRRTPPKERTFANAICDRVGAAAAPTPDLRSLGDGHPRLD